MPIGFIYPYPFGTDVYGWQIKDYFNAIYRSGHLERAIKEILKKEGYSLDYNQCMFPEDNSYDDYDHFEGVEFEMGYMDDESSIIVSEKECLSFVKEVIFLYENMRPDRKGFADADLAKSTLGR